MRSYLYASLAGVGLGVLLTAPLLPANWWRIPLYVLLALVAWCVTAAIIWSPFGRLLKEWQR
jgi:hypothetical protein